MTKYQHNNLDRAASPYLQQHKNNPIHWQEWKQPVLDYAKKHNKLLFVSSGYATCHWCHVMAAEAFSNKEIAAFLNAHFVAIKIDREQRPDIDQYMMSFLIVQQGHGGWPLNVIMTPDSKPFFACTYLPIYSNHELSGFLEMLQFAKTLYEKKETKDFIQPFSLSVPEGSRVDEQDILATILSAFDEQYGGCGFDAKFPPHNTLLFLLHWYAHTKEEAVKTVLEKTLDTMAMRGLHDHLQGGFYRYCVDRAWTTPHFEKMLYDQALLLWVYAAAYKVFAKKEYKTLIEKIMQCLEETFEENGLFYSGHDADTDHEEGATSLWGKKELENVLTQEEYAQFMSLYDITDQGNFEGKNHLIKKQLLYLPAIEKKLLAIRKKRKQPFVDKKIITSWNALIGIGFIMASRFGCSENGLSKAETLFQKLLQKHYTKEKLTHTSLGTLLQKEGEFLEDYASVLLFTTYLYEEKPTIELKTLLEIFFQKVQTFKKSHSNWYENKTSDFVEIPAQTYDHPAPSSVSLAECALFRAKLFLEKEYEPAFYQQPLAHDFYNLMVFLQQEGHLLSTPNKLPWSKVPLHCIQRQGIIIQDCFQQHCQEFTHTDELLSFLQTLNI